MASKTISLSEEAYEKLKAEKSKGESFSKVVKRLIKKRPLPAFAGAWKDLEEEKIEEIKNILKREREISLAGKRSWVD
ncbi:MAG: antitoxin VapB family protein [Candidatus Hydrothermarchaeales archaeon]